MPKISIIVPVYNVEKYLRQCMDSLVNQTLEDIEIICINDETPDNSLEILNEYAQIDSRVKVISQKNTGLSGARNTGNKYVTGEYLMYIDSDDWLDLETCETAYNEAVKENADAVLWAYVREYADGKKPKYLFNEDRIVFDKTAVKEKLHRRFLGLLGEELSNPEQADSLVTAWGKLIRSSIILDNNLEFISTKEIGTEDAIFNIYAFGYVNRAVYLNKTFNHYRRDNLTSLTKTYKPMLYSQWQKLFGLMADYIEKNNLEDYYRKSLDNRIALSIIGLGLNIMSGKMSGRQKRKEIKSVIDSESYRNAYKQLTLKYFPIHWKVFFLCAKLNFATGVYLLLWAIKKILKR